MYMNPSSFWLRDGLGLIGSYTSGRARDQLD